MEVSLTFFFVVGTIIIILALMLIYTKMQLKEEIKTVHKYYMILKDNGFTESNGLIKKEYL